MKILFIAQGILRNDLGGPKAVMELGAVIRQLGHSVTIVSIEEVEQYLKKRNISINKSGAKYKSYPVAICKYLECVINEYDIIDCEQSYLTVFLKKEYNTKSLIVARSVLFLGHMKYIKWPVPQTFKSAVWKFLRKLLNKEINYNYLISTLYSTYEKADLINVNNHRDVELLKSNGIQNNKIVNLPCGLYSDDNLFNLALHTRHENTLGFIGTFDYRKGCFDIPKIFAKVKEEVPDAKLILLGAKGLFQNTSQILKFFPHHLHDSITIVLSYKKEQLINYLKNVKVGIFPSYLEGFGFGVLEMLAAGIPTVAYDAPGLSSILPSIYTTKNGDHSAMAEKAINLLCKNSLYKDQELILQISKQYDWKKIANDTISIYYSKFMEKQSLQEVNS